VASGVATHRIASARFPDLLEALCGAVSVDAVLGAFAESPGEGALSTRRPMVDRLLEGERIEDILTRLDVAAADNTPNADFARATAASIRSKAPLSLKITLAQLRRGRKLDFAECMRTEFRIVSRVVRGHDFYEGVRAVIIDKDHAPRWRPALLADVSDAEVAGYFAPVAGELDLP
jgi:enoyl-CoA hydratase